MSDVPPPPGPGSPSQPGPLPGPPAASAPAEAGQATSGPAPKGEGPLETAVGVLTSPVSTLRGLAAEPRVGWAIGLVVVLGLVSAVEMAGVLASPEPAPFGPAAPAPLEQLRWLALIGGAIFLPLLFLGFVAVWSAILHGLARLFGGEGRYRAVFTTVGFASTPQVFTVVGTVLSVTLGLAGDVLSGLLSVGLGVWTAILTVIAVRASHGLSTGRAVAVYLIPLAVLIVLGILVVVLVIALVVGGMGAALGVGPS